MRLAALDNLVIGLPDQCWPWGGALYASGYGQGWDGKKNRRVHRFIYELAFGEIPDGLTIDHLCGTKSCCNPAHLEAVTVGENVRRANMGRPLSEAHRVKISAGVRERGARQTPEGRERVAAAKTEYWRKWNETNTPIRVRSEEHKRKKRERERAIRAGQAL
jgi:hypothetical protein